MPSQWAELPSDEAAHRVKIGIESDHGVWVQALVAAGYEVFAINPFSVGQYRSRHSTSGAKSDVADAHLLAEVVRLDRRITARSLPTLTGSRRSSLPLGPTRR
jgi:transposase